MKKIWILLAVLVTAFTTNATADQDAENEALGKMIAELQVLSTLADKAQAQADAGQRVTFNYDAIKADIHTIQLGLEQYRAGIRNQPRQIEPLVGDYRR